MGGVLPSTRTLGVPLPLLQRKKETKLEVMTVEKENSRGGADPQTEGAEVSPQLTAICITLLLILYILVL